MGEVAVELNITGKIAAALSAGIGPGTIHEQMAGGGFESKSVVCAVVAAHFRYYALGNFDRGLFAGAETVFFYMDRDSDTSVAPAHEGMWIGPTVGYKHTFDFGLALSAGITAALPIFKADGLDEDLVPGGVEDEHPFIGPVLLGPNASVGWAF